MVHATNTQHSPLQPLRRDIRLRRRRLIISIYTSGRTTSNISGKEQMARKVPQGQSKMIESVGRTIHRLIYSMIMPFDPSNHQSMPLTRPIFCPINQEIIISKANCKNQTANEKRKKKGIASQKEIKKLQPVYDTNPPIHL